MRDANRPRIAVIMAAYNERPSWLAASIESILNQTWHNLRFYITLDNPTNSELDAMIQRYADADDRIVYERNKENIGLIGSLNKLIRKTDERYIARMDADDVSVPQRLEVEMRELSESDLDFVMGGVDFISEHSASSPGRVFPRLRPEDIAELQKYVNVSAHSTWLMRAEVYALLDGYRDVANCEDLDFMLRAIQGGFKIGYIPEILLNYRLRDDSISSSNILNQDLKAELLRHRYMQGLEISSEETLAELRKIDDATSAPGFEGFSDSKRNLDRFTSALYEKRIADCVAVVLKNYFTDGFFRRRFNNALTARLRTRRIIRRAASRSEESGGR